MNKQLNQELDSEKKTNEGKRSENRRGKGRGGKGRSFARKRSENKIEASDTTTQTPQPQGVSLDSVIDANKGAKQEKPAVETPQKFVSTRVAVKTDIPAARIAEDPWNLRELDHVEYIFTPCTQDTTITASCEGLPSLLKETHTALQNVSSVYAEHISESMLHYYMTVLSQARNCELRALRGNQSTADQRLVEMLRHVHLHIPPHLKRWLEVQGDFVDPDNNKVRFIPSDAPDEDGSFGPVTADNHTRYETELSPLISQLRLCADLEYSHNDRFEREWDLPEDLRPREPAASKPTGNMLGWAKATRLTDQQIQLLNHCGIRLEEHGVVFPHSVGDAERYLVNERLIQEVSKYLSSASTAMTINVYQCGASSTTGSRALLMYVTSRDITGYNPHSVHVDRATTTHLDVNLDMRIVHLYNAYCLRVKRLGHGLRNWCCYRFNEYREVPDSWFRTRNACYEAGSSATWDDPTQYGPEVDRRKLLRNLIHMTILKKNLD